MNRYPLISSRDIERLKSLVQKRFNKAGFLFFKYPGKNDGPMRFEKGAEYGEIGDKNAAYYVGGYQIVLRSSQICEICTLDENNIIDFV